MIPTNESREKERERRRRIDRQINTFDQPDVHRPKKNENEKMYKRIRKKNKRKRGEDKDAYEERIHKIAMRELAQKMFPAGLRDVIDKHENPL